MTIYEIDERLASCVDPETGEVLDNDALDALQMARDEKIENVACWIKNELSLIDGMKLERANLAVRVSTAEKRVERLKNYLAYALDGHKWQSAKASISFRNSQAVEITDAALIPADYIRVKEVREPDKIKIKDALTEGEIIPGTRLQKNLNVQIK